MSKERKPTLTCLKDNLSGNKSNEKFESCEKKESETFEFVDVSELTHDDLRNSLSRVSENPVEPFTFLNNITEDAADSPIVPTETDIDIQLATLCQRIKLNKSLLERTNNRIKKVNFSEEIAEIDDEIDSTANFPGINDVNEALKSTLETLSRMKELISENAEVLK